MTINVTLPKVENTLKEEVVVKQEAEISAFQFVRSTENEDSFRSESATEESSFSH